MEKKMRIITGSISREIAQKANELGIQKEDIVSLIVKEGQFILFYYK